MGARVPLMVCSPGFEADMSKAPVIAAVLSVCSMTAAQAPVKVDFGRDIQPLLREHCVECHGPSQQKRRCA